jgi:hypothetical protein
MGLPSTFLATAASDNPGNITMGLLLFWLASLAMIVALVFLPMRFARASRWREIINVGALLWGALAAWSAIGFSHTYAAWSQERLLLIQTGYYDPAGSSGAPLWPWAWWIVLASFYVLICAWAFFGSRRGPI